MGIKISICGKGGSGKSTLVSLLANVAQAGELTTLVVDSDESNSGLFRMLGVNKPPIPLMALAGLKGDPLGRRRATRQAADILDFLLPAIKSHARRCPNGIRPRRLSADRSVGGPKICKRQD